MEHRCGTTYRVTLRYVTFNNRQDVMQLDSSGLTLPQAHDITQEKPFRLLLSQAVDLKGLQLTWKRKIKGLPGLSFFSHVLPLLWYLLGAARGGAAQHGAIGDSSTEG